MALAGWLPQTLTWLYDDALDSLGHPNARNIKPANVMDTSLIEEIRKSGFFEKLYGRAPKNER